MCPLCIGTGALLISGGTSAGLTALVLGKCARRRGMRFISRLLKIESDLTSSQTSLMLQDADRPISIGTQCNTTNDSQAADRYRSPGVCRLKFY